MISYFIILWYQILNSISYFVIAIIFFLSNVISSLLQASRSGASTEGERLWDAGYENKKLEGKTFQRNSRLWFLFLLNFFIFLHFYKSNISIFPISNSFISSSVPLYLPLPLTLTLILTLSLLPSSSHSNHTSYFPFLLISPSFSLCLHLSNSCVWY